MKGTIQYLDITGTALTAPTTVGTDTTSSALSLSVSDLKRITETAGIVAVRYKVSTTVKSAVASVVEGASCHIDIVEAGTLNVITYSIKEVSSAVKVVGSIVKAGAAT